MKGSFTISGFMFVGFLLLTTLSALGQTDHGGTNVTWENQQVGGVHYNIGTLTVDGNVTVTPLSALVVTAAIINVNGALSANSAGYAPSAGSQGDGGSGDNNQGGGGGGYGGTGGNGNNYPTLGAGGTNWGNPSISIEMDAPDEFGSGGGTCGLAIGGRGGGAIKLVATNTLTVSGQVSADGQEGQTGSDDGAGGGSGGSVWLVCNTLAGGGSISATGGNGQDSNGDGGGGGGGRIAVYYTNDNSAIFYMVSAGVGHGGATDGSNGTFRINGSDGVPVSPTNSLWDHGGYDWIVAEDQEIGYVHTNINNFIVTNCTATVAPNVNLRVYATNVIIAGDAVLTASGSSDSTVGQGYGTYAGAGYGGAGGGTVYRNMQSGWPYGNPSVTNEMRYPDELGSKGSSRGGGAIQLVASAFMKLDGSVAANGSNGGNGNGAGSGGSIWLDCATFTGGGAVSARGGNASGSGGAGGGGRIAVYFGVNSSSVTLDESTVAGGSGASELYNGQSGTLWVNSGLAFTNSWALQDHGGADWIISSDAYNIAGVHTNVGVFQVNSNATATALSGTKLAIYADEINVYGTLTADGKGYYSGTPVGSDGDGEDGGNNTGSGGGGYGGAGGSSSVRAGGIAWGDPDIEDETEHPDELGGAGGHSNGPGNGGPGGGAIRLRARGNMTVDGAVTANGLDGWAASDDGNAGGAGGSIWLFCRTLAGTGTVSAAGGAADPYDTRTQGGGGGGRIAIYYLNRDQANLTTNVSAGLDARNAIPAEDGTCFEKQWAPAGMVLIVR